MENKYIWDFDDLIQKLEAEHQEQYVYRGQIREYTTILPSLYRGLVDEGSLFKRGDIISLYNKGEYFYKTHDRLDFTEEFRRKFYFGKFVIGLFGIPLGNLFCQHCCVPTEGLDVTRNHLIASLFAIFDYDNNKYFDNHNEYGVIYRVTISSEKFTQLSDLKNIGTYTCPSYLDGINVLSLIKKCDTIEESTNSYREFQFEDLYLKTQTNIDLSEYWLHRPLEKLELPQAELNKGRIFKQEAGLLFSDLIYNHNFDTRPRSHVQGKYWYGSLCIEDLSKRQSVEVFRFRHSKDNQHYLGLDPKTIFPENDPIRSMLLNIFTGLYGKPLLYVDGGVGFYPGEEKKVVE